MRTKYLSYKKESGMTIIVTGGAGFIGCNFIKYWMGRHPKDWIVCVDKLTYAGRPENLADVINRQNFRLVKADICDREAMEGLFHEETPQAVVSFAAESHVDRSIKNPALFLRSNILGVSVLMDCCKKTGTHFHQISTDEVYGDLPLDGCEAFTESTSLHGPSPYAASKASADLLVLAYHRTYGLPVTITRCSNNYGPYQHPEKFIPLVIQHALRNQPIPIHGDGKDVRDWIHVIDHCRAVESVLLHGNDGEIYNVDGNCEVSNIDIIKKILDILERPHRLITFDKDRPGHDRRYAINTGKIEKELGWNAKVDFEKGLRKTVLWYVDLYRC